MVSKGQIGIGTVIVMCAVAAGAMLYPTTDTMPGADVSFGVGNLTDLNIRSFSPPPLHASYSFYDYKLYEGLEFEVTVTDSNSRSVQGANVSFMIPTIYALTDSDGSAFFTAPFISKASAPHLRVEYIASPGDTSCTFPLSVKKEGYISVNKTIVVHIRK